MNNAHAYVSMFWLHMWSSLLHKSTWSGLNHNISSRMWCMIEYTNKTQKAHPIHKTISKRSEVIRNWIVERPLYNSTIQFLITSLLFEMVLWTLSTIQFLITSLLLDMVLWTGCAFWVNKKTSFIAHHKIKIIIIK